MYGRATNKNGRINTTCGPTNTCGPTITTGGPTKKQNVALTTQLVVIPTQVALKQCVTNTILMSEYEYEYIRVDFLWRIRIRIYSDPIF